MPPDSNPFHTTVIPFIRVEHASPMLKRITTLSELLDEDEALRLVVPNNKDGANGAPCQIVQSKLHAIAPQTFNSRRKIEASGEKQAQTYRKLWSYAKKIELVSNLENQEALSSSSVRKELQATPCSRSQSPSLSKNFRGGYFKSLEGESGSDEDSDFGLGLYELDVDENTNSNIDIRPFLMSSPSYAVHHKEAPFTVLTSFQNINPSTSCRSFLVESRSGLLEKISADDIRRPPTNVIAHLSVKGFRIIQDIENGTQEVQYRIHYVVEGAETSEIWKTFQDFKYLVDALKYHSKCRVDSSCWLFSFVSPGEQESKSVKPVYNCHGDLYDPASYSSSGLNLEGSLRTWQDVMRIRPWLGRNLTVSYLMEEMGLIQAFISTFFFEIPSIDIFNAFIASVDDIHMVR